MNRSAQGPHESGSDIKLITTQRQKRGLYDIYIGTTLDEFELCQSYEHLY